MSKSSVRSLFVYVLLVVFLLLPHPDVPCQAQCVLRSLHVLNLHEIATAAFPLLTPTSMYVFSVRVQSSWIANLHEIGKPAFFRDRPPTYMYSVCNVVHFPTAATSTTHWLSLCPIGEVSPVCSSLAKLLLGTTQALSTGPG